MATLALFTLSTLLLRSTQGIPVPQADVDPSAAASAAGGPSVATSAPAASATGAGIKSASTAPTDPSDELPTSSSSGSSSAPDEAGASAGVSQLNGMSTEQLAMYVGIGMSSTPCLKDSR